MSPRWGCGAALAATATWAEDHWEARELEELFGGLLRSSVES